MNLIQKYKLYRHVQKIVIPPQGEYLLGDQSMSYGYMVKMGNEHVIALKTMESLFAEQSNFSYQLQIKPQGAKRQTPPTYVNEGLFARFIFNILNRKEFVR